jgi:hypothetical protein
MIFEMPGKATGEGITGECAIMFDCSLCNIDAERRLKSAIVFRISIPLWTLLLKEPLINPSFSRTQEKI